MDRNESLSDRPFSQQIDAQLQHHIRSTMNSTCYDDPRKDRSEPAACQG
ncbi:unnamed protein product, partial [Rotaria magnacalcarata]